MMITEAQYKEEQKRLRDRWEEAKRQRDLAQVAMEDFTLQREELSREYAAQLKQRLAAATEGAGND